MNRNIVFPVDRNQEKTIKEAAVVWTSPLCSCLFSYLGCNEVLTRKMHRRCGSVARSPARGHSLVKHPSGQYWD